MSRYTNRSAVYELVPPTPGAPVQPSCWSRFVSSVKSKRQLSPQTRAAFESWDAGAVANYSAESKSIARDRFHRLVTLHGVLAISYVIIALVVAPVFLGVGGGTKVANSYQFADYRTTTNNTLVEYVIATPSSSTVVAEAVVPIYGAISFVYHAFIWWFGEWYTEYSMRAEWNPVAWAKNLLVCPLIMVQIAITCYITDVEKVALIVMLSLALVYMDFSLEEHLYVTTVGSILAKRDITREVESKLSTMYVEQVKAKQTPTFDQNPLIQAEAILDIGRPASGGIWVLGTIIWITLWIILWTNISWQTNHGNAPQHAFPVFLFVFIANAALRVHQVMYVLRWKWWNTFAFVELLNIVIPSVTVFFLTFISLPSSL